MQKSVKILLFVGFPLIIIVSMIFIGLSAFNVAEKEQEGKPFSLEDAPSHIIEIKADLKNKFENETFTWSDMPRFVTFCQYLADNAPDILELLTGWEQIVLFDFHISNGGKMWWLISSESRIIEIGTNPPHNYGILIDLTWDTFIDIMKQDETPLSAFIKGDLEYKGSFDEVLKVAKLTNIAAATIMDTYIPPIGETDYNITIDNSNLYVKGGLTLFPIFEVQINPSHIGEPHMTSPRSGAVVIVNQYGKVVLKLENTAHSVHKFINSSTVMMGGQEGLMELWNYKDNLVEPLTVPGGHHDLDYNPVTETFMVLEYIDSTNETWDGKTVIFDLLSEYTRTGELVWQWDPRIYFPFNSTRHTSLGLNETFRGKADWMHSNSFVWDKDSDVIYLNIRNLDTILKINYTTKEIIWDAGRGGDFTLYNKAGEEVNTIFCHPHGLEQIGPNRFIIYDNDLYNQSNPATMTLKNSSGHSRYLEFEIDEENRIMRELWSWVPPDESYYFPESGGDADRLPNGNTVGTFGGKGMILNMRDPVIITEVTKDGQIAWELQIPGKNDTYYWVHQVERFYEKPLITVQNQSIDLKEGTLCLNTSTWNNIKQESPSPGIVRIIVDEQVIFQESFDFLSQWKPTPLKINVTNLPSNFKSIEVNIENSDGVISSVMIFKESSGGSSKLFSFLIHNVPFIIGGGLMVIVAIPAGYFLWKRIMKTRRHLENNQE